MLDPGSIIALTQIAFKGACIAVRTSNRALHFFEDSDVLSLRLDVQRIRLQTWGENAGVLKGELDPTMLLIHETIVRELDLIKGLFQDADKMRERYGMKALEETGKQPGKGLATVMSKMRRAIRGSGIQVQLDDGDNADDDLAGAVVQQDHHDRDPGVWKRVAWGARGKEQFAARVTELTDHIDTLNKLLTERGQRKTAEDGERLRIIVVGSAVDDESLALIRSAAGISGDDKGTEAMIERKMLVEDRRWTSSSSMNGLRSFTKGEFEFPPNHSQNQRFLAMMTSSDKVIMVEKKSFDANITPKDKDALFSRVQRLMMLLSKPKTPSFQTPKALGHINDPSNFCWWLIFDMKVAPSTTLTASTEPITLSHLLQPTTKYRPPLERRLQLASTICNSLSELYSGGWMHKSMRSSNIIFPLPSTVPSSFFSSESNKFLSDALLAGFEYSRQESEAQSIDRARLAGDVDTAIYRHPHYQGEAAEGYRIEYDIYSVGLVLVEIALWVPLKSFLSTKDKEGKPKFASSKSGAKSFHREEATVLKDLVVECVDKKVAFQMGTGYRDAARWCLQLADGGGSGTDAEREHPALSFYNHVVVPLNNSNML